MRPKLYQTTHGYDLITSDLRLYSLFQTTSGWSYQFKGVINAKYVPAGVLAKGVPNHLKRLFFSLNKILHFKQGRDGIYRINEDVKPKFYSYKKKVRNNFQEYNQLKSK